MLDPVGVFEVGGSELAGVGGVEFFGDEAFEDLGVPFFVDVLEADPHILGIQRWVNVEPSVDLLFAERVFV